MPCGSGGGRVFFTPRGGTIINVLYHKGTIINVTGMSVYAMRIVVGKEGIKENEQYFCSFEKNVVTLEAISAQGLLVTGYTGTLMAAKRLLLSGMCGFAAFGGRRHANALRIWGLRHE